MSAEIKVDGKKIPLSEFPEEIISNAIVGMVKSLKGVEEVNKLEIMIEI